MTRTLTILLVLAGFLQTAIRCRAADDDAIQAIGSLFSKKKPAATAAAVKQTNMVEKAMFYGTNFGKGRVEPEYRPDRDTKPEHFCQPEWEWGAQYLAEKKGASQDVQALSKLTGEMLGNYFQDAYAAKLKQQYEANAQKQRTVQEQLDQAKKVNDAAEQYNKELKVEVEKLKNQKTKTSADIDNAKKTKVNSEAIADIYDSEVKRLEAEKEKAVNENLTKQAEDLETNIAKLKDERDALRENVKQLGSIEQNAG